MCLRLCLYVWSHFSFKYQTFIANTSFFSRFDHLSPVSSHAKLAICTRCPFIFRRPICGTHGTLLGPNPSLGSGPIVAKERPKNLPYRLHWEASPSSSAHFSPSSVCKQSLSSSCTHLTPNPSAEAHSGVGATSRDSRYRETQHHNSPHLLPAFSEPCAPLCPPPHTPLPCPLLFLSECSGKSLGIFTLLFLLSTVVTKTKEYKVKSCTQMKSKIRLISSWCSAGVIEFIVISVFNFHQLGSCLDIFKYELMPYKLS